MQRKVEKSEEEWKKQLAPERYRVLRKGATERPFTGELLHNKEKGMYVCGACGAELFTSETKYDSGSGWPSFYAAASKDMIEERDDKSLLMHRTEILCKNCGGHLGHVFEDGPQPTGLRYCVNSLSLGFKKQEKAEEKKDQ
jgi:peptide-methionine (R)-S-oxide reductase